MRLEREPVVEIISKVELVQLECIKVAAAKQ